MNDIPKKKMIYLIKIRYVESALYKRRITLDRPEKDNKNGNAVINQVIGH